MQHSAVERRESTENPVISNVKCFVQEEKAEMCKIYWPEVKKKNRQSLRGIAYVLIMRVWSVLGLVWETLCPLTSRAVKV